MWLVKRKIIDIIRSYGERLRKKRISLHKLILFGSYAANAERLDSDIGIAIVSGAFSIDRFHARAMLIKIAFYVDARIEPYPISLQAFNENNWQTIIREIKSKGIEIAA